MRIPAATAAASLAGVTWLAAPRTGGASPASRLSIVLAADCTCTYDATTNMCRPSASAGAICTLLGQLQNPNNQWSPHCARVQNPRTNAYSCACSCY